MTTLRAHCSLPNAAKQLHIAYTTAVGLTKKGELPCSWIGGKRIIFLDDLKKYADKINSYSNAPYKEIV